VTSTRQSLRQRIGAGETRETPAIPQMIDINPKTLASRPNPKQHRFTSYISVPLLKPCKHQPRDISQISQACSPLCFYGQPVFCGTSAPSSPKSIESSIFISDASSSKRYAATFSRILGGLSLFGNGMSPCCRHQRMSTWEGVAVCRSAIPRMVGSSVRVPRTRGQYASTWISFCRQYSTIGLCWHRTWH